MRADAWRTQERSSADGNAVVEADDDVPLRVFLALGQRAADYARNAEKISRGENKNEHEQEKKKNEYKMIDAHF